MSKIIIADGQTSKILDHIHKYDVIDNTHERNMSTWVEAFKFTTFASKRYAQYLLDRNRLIIPDEGGTYRELIIKDTKRTSSSGVPLVKITSYGFYQDLITSKIIEPGTTSSQTPEAHMREILAGTEVRVGEVAYTGNIRTITRENKTDPFSALKSLANEFDLELDFRIEVDRGTIIRYADLVEHIGEWRGRTVEFGYDLQSVSRNTDANNIVTALRVVGPEREDGTRLEGFVEDEDARNRWSRNGEHLVKVYEPETENQNITKERLETLGRTELNKRINALVTWEINVIDLEHVPGMQNKKIRYGDTIRVKDTTFNPPFYVEARIFKQRRNIFDPASKEVTLGDFREYTVEEVRSNWETIREELEKKIREAEERAKWRANHGSKIRAIMPLSSQKARVDSQYTEIIDNPDLSSAIRGQLTVAKTSYDVSYNSLMTAVEAKDKLDNPTETDVEEVYSLLGSYELELSSISSLIESAMESISKNYTNDHIDVVNRELEEASKRIDDARIDIDRARSDLDIARVDLDQTKIDLNDSRERLGGAEVDLRNAREDLSRLETDLRDAENSLRDKVDLVDYNEKITDITREMADKVDGEWVDGRLRVEVDGESKLIYVKEDIDGMINNTVSRTTYETDQEGYIERFKDYETNIIQTWEEINARLKSTDYNTDQNRLENRLAEWEATADGFRQSVSRLQTDLDNLEFRDRNLVLNSNIPVTSTAYRITGYDMSIDWVTGEEWTVIIKGEINEGQKFGIWANGSQTIQGHLTNLGDGYHKLTFVVREPTNSGANSGPKKLNVYNVPSSGASQATIEWIKLVRGNRTSLDWSPAPEDSITYTETRIEQLADKIALEYIKDDELIGGIRIGDANPINGANVEITGDTAIYGRISAPDATFLRITTEDMTAIRTTIQDSKITGTLDANEALFQKGRFEEAHLVRGKIEEADIINADIRNATITGSLNSVGGTFTGKLDGVDGTFTGELVAAIGTFRGNMEAGSITSNTTIDVTTDLNVGDNITLSSGDLRLGYPKKLTFHNGLAEIESRTVQYVPGGPMEAFLTVTASSALNIDSPHISLTGGDVINFANGSSIDNTGGVARWRQSNSDYIYQNGSLIQFYEGGRRLARFDVDVAGSYRHGRLTMGAGMLKITGNPSNAQIQARNQNDSAYIQLTTSQVNETSSEIFKSNIVKYEASALDIINQTVLYEFDKEGIEGRQIGVIIERETPDIFVNPDRESIAPSTMTNIALKGIQELDQTTNKRITNLEVENQMLKERVRQLEANIA